MKNSGIGGQAVIEGVMMKNRNQCAVAVRKPDHEIEIKKSTQTSIRDKYKAARFPVIRGVIVFAESLLVGMKTLNYSASFYEEEEEKEKKGEKDEKKENLLMGLLMVAAILIAIGIFVVVPFLVSEALAIKGFVRSAQLRGLIEGVLRVVLFLVYIKLITLMEDIERVFMYHGAEHKTINCVENGYRLTVGNVKKQSMVHKRCGTSFMLVVMLVSILFFMFIVVGNVWLRMALRILLIPVIAGVSYEFIRYAGNHDGPVVNVLSKPGLWLQGLTTREPDEEMIEVAIASVEAVFDWQEFLEEMKKETAADTTMSADSTLVSDGTLASGHTPKPTSDGTLAAAREEEPLEKETQKKEEPQAKEAPQAKAGPEEDMEVVSIESGSEEEDEILNALDRYFEAPEKEDKS